MSLAKNHSIERIQLSDLVVNPENYRHDTLSNEVDAINYFIENNKTYNLAKLGQDIIDKGMDPSRRILVTKNELFPNKYLVLEGNRRVTTLKLINDPTLSLDPKIQAEFTQFNLVNNFNPEIECSMISGEDEASHWIMINHTPMKGTLSTVAWDTLQKRRYSTKNGYRSETLILINYLLANPNFDEDTKNRIEKFPVTNLDRLLSSKDFRNFLTIQFNKENCIFLRSDADSILKQIIIDFTGVGKNNGYTVRDIYFVGDRLAYIDSLKTRLGIIDPMEAAIPLSDVLPNQISLDEYTDTTSIQETPMYPNTNDSPMSGNDTSNENKTDYSAPNGNPIITKPVAPKPRKTLIPIHISIDFGTSYTRESSIFYELKKINIEHINAVSVLFRVFLELSIEQYLKRNSITFKNEDSLSKKLELSATDFKKKNRLSRDKLKPINIAISTKNSLLGVDTLNAYVHSSSFNPLISDLLSTWDNYQEFIIKLWQD